MDKHTKLEAARLLQIQAFNLSEMPASNQIRKHAIEQGYKYLRIALTDMETGETLPNIFTMRRPENLGQLLDDLLKVGQWPRELLEDFINAPIDSGVELTDGAKMARLISEKQLGGGRPNQEGISPEKAKEYRDLNKWYFTTGLSQREFCKEARVSRTKLQNAMKYVRNNGP